MEPHWNEARIQQVIGRVVRYQSHNNLNINERNVTIIKWLSVFPKSINIHCKGLKSLYKILMILLFKI